MWLCIICCMYVRLCQSVQRSNPNSWYHWYTVCMHVFVHIRLTTEFTRIDLSLSKSVSRETRKTVQVLHKPFQPKSSIRSEHTICTNTITHGKETNSHTHTPHRLARRWPLLTAIHITDKRTIQYRNETTEIKATTKLKRRSSGCSSYAYTTLVVVTHSKHPHTWNVCTTQSLLHQIVLHNSFFHFHFCAWSFSGYIFCYFVFLPIHCAESVSREHQTACQNPHFFQFCRSFLVLYKLNLRNKLNKRKERYEERNKKARSEHRKHIVCVLIGVQNRISSFSERKSRKEYTTENWKKERKKKKIKDRMKTLERR